MLKEASIAEMNKQKIPKYLRILVNRGRGNDDLAPAEDLYQEMMGLKVTLAPPAALLHVLMYSVFIRSFRLF